MLGSSSAIDNNFRPHYSLKWYFPIAFGILTSVAYIRSKAMGEDIAGILEFLGIAAIAYSMYFIAFAITRIEFSQKIKIKRVLWQTNMYEYKHILEVRLPEVIIDSNKPLKLENIVNLDELQQEFKNLEIMGLIQKGRVKELQPEETRLSLKPRFRDIMWTLLTVFVLGNELFEISKEANILLIIVLGIYFVYEIFSRLFRKPKDE